MSAAAETRRRDAAVDLLDCILERVEAPGDGPAPCPSCGAGQDEPCAPNCDERTEA